MSNDKHLQEELEAAYTSIGVGWWPIAHKYIHSILELDPECTFCVKEKYGELRLQASPATDDDDAVIAIQDLEREAEELSLTICEECGEPGAIRTDRPWMKTLCDECSNLDEEGERKQLEKRRQFLDEMGRWNDMHNDELTYEIWLGEHYSHFERGVMHRANGSTVPLKGWIHSSTYSVDSILIADEARYYASEFPLRWYIEPNRIGFYCWDDRIVRLILHNDSGKELIVGSYGVLSPGETWDLQGV